MFNFGFSDLYVVGTLLFTKFLSQTSSAPTVQVKNGTLLGIHSDIYNQDYFLGVPFAQPPTQGPRRFAPPYPLNTTWTGTKNVTEYGNMCYGFGGDADRVGNFLSEDCLNLNIVRPSGFQDTLLPVGVYIYGGGYFEGANRDQRMNFSNIIQDSVAAGVPFIGVSINYRVHALGFMGGSEILKAGAANLGLRDQRLALHWIKENIAAFGGDPSRVTIWGESAGAGSVGAHLLAYNGRDDDLFVGAIAQSGSPAGFRPSNEYPGLPTSSWDTIFDSLVNATGCNAAASQLTCLRDVPIDTLSPMLNSGAIQGTMYGPILDNDFVADVPAQQLRRGAFVKVPFLMGTNSDEGAGPFTGFSVNSDLDFLNKVKSARFTEAQAKIIASVYPVDSPENVVVTYHDDLPGVVGKQYKRAATFIGDAKFIAPTRYAAKSWASYNVPLFSYRWNVITAGTPNYIGAGHAHEIAFVFDDTKNTTNYDVDPFLGKPTAYFALAKTMAVSWATFISTGDPNGQFGVHNLNITWPKYTTASPTNLVFDANVTSFLEPDTYRATGIGYLNSLYDAA